MEKKTPMKNIMLKASVIMTAIMFAARFLGYAFHYTFVRFFSTQDYGSFVYLWSLAMFYGGLLPNISVAVARYVAYYRGAKDEDGIESTIRTSIVLNAVLLFLACAILSLAYILGFFNMDGLSFAFMLAVIVLTLTTNLFSGVFSGFRKPEMATFFNLVQNVLRLLAVLAAAYLTASYIGILWLVGVSFLISTCMLVVWALREYGTGSRPDIGIGRVLLGFGFFSIVLITANNMLAWAAIFMLKYFEGATNVAIYNVAWLASTGCLLFFTAILQIFSPVVSEMFGSKRLGQVGYVTSYILESFFLLFLPIFLAISLFARQLLVVFVRSEYAGGAVPLQILSAGAFMFGIAILFIELTNCEGKPQVNARNISVGAALNIAMNYLLIPGYGMIGAALSSVVSSAAILLMSYWHVRGFVKLSYSPARLLKIFLSSAAAIAAVYAVNIVPMHELASIIVLSLTLVAVYSAAIIWLKALRVEDVESALMILNKAKTPAKIKASVMSVLQSAVTPTPAHRP